MKKGARDYITKPFDIDEIKVKIERALLEQNLQGRLKTLSGSPGHSSFLSPYGWFWELSWQKIC